MVNVCGDFVNRSSGPRGPVPLLLGSCVISKIGSLKCFLCKILFSMSASDPLLDWSGSLMFFIDWCGVSVFSVIPVPSSS